MGQFVLHLSERRGVAAICAAALNEREAQARHKTPSPGPAKGMREFTHENDSYRELFCECAASHAHAGSVEWTVSASPTGRTLLVGNFRGLG